jgi:rare lipoprotein A (peptidoglycan hydrolase)
MGRLVVVAFAAAVMVVAPLALLHGGAAHAAATAHVALGGRPSATSPTAATIGDTQALASDVKTAPTTPAERARHTAAVQRAEATWDQDQALHSARLRHAAAIRHAEAVHAAQLEHAAQVRHAAAVRRAEARWHAEQVRHAAAVRRAAAAHRAATAAHGHSRVGIATWYAWHPGQCASPFLPHGTLITVTDLATHKSIQCLVTDTEAHNPGRVVDLSNYCFEQLAALSQGVIDVRISW